MEEKALKDKIMSVAKKEIRVQYKDFESVTSIYDSKIGGRPSVPCNFIWPEYEISGICDDEPELAPLSFLAQINLKDVAVFDDKNILPHTGMLSFFYQLETMCWGDDPSDNGSARVFYFPDEVELAPASYPEDLIQDVTSPELAVTFESHISFPDHKSLSESNIDCEWEAYVECLNFFGWECDEMGRRTKLIGYPDTVQENMELQCEILSRGHRYEYYSQLKESEKEKIRKQSEEWILLFQMGTVSTKDFSFMFGDCGHIYFWMKKSDLEKLNFDKVWLILQCG